MMPPPLQLPTIQNWSCHNCGGCCKQHAIEITAEEHTRIAAQGWTAADGIPAGRPLFVWSGGPPWKKRYRLGHQADGACVFLDERGLCRIHARFGEAAKPLACRIYPYAFHPAGKTVTVSLRFSCPSVVANKGQPIAAQKSDLREIEKLVVPGNVDKYPPPFVTPGQRLDWPDTLRIVEKIGAILAADDAPFTVRLLRAVTVVNLIGQSRFDAIRGDRLEEFLTIITEAARGEIPGNIREIPEPSRTARVHFRLLVAQYARKDTFAESQGTWRDRWRLFRAAIRFAKGVGLAPPLQEQFTEVPFAEIEREFGPRPVEVEEIFTRYFRVKVQGLHFCGPAYYHVPLVEGFQSLALIYPAILWIARWLAVGAGRSSLTTEDVTRALAIADHHHGYSPAFGHRPFRSRVRQLDRLNEITRLIAWYSR